MSKTQETVLTIPHTDGSQDKIRIIVPMWMNMEEEAEFVRVLMEGIPRAACFPVNAWLRFLHPHRADGGLEGEDHPIKPAPPSSVLFELVERAEKRAGVKPIPDDVNITITSLGFLALDGWKEEVVRSCCALLRTLDGRALARMRVEEGPTYSLWISDEETGRTASFRLEYWHLPHIAGRLIKGWERVVGRVRFDEEKRLHFVRVEGDAEIGLDLRASEGLEKLARAIGLDLDSPSRQGGRRSAR